MGADVEADGAVGFLPRLAQVEEAEVGQVEQAAAVEVILVQYQNTGAGSGLPFKAVGIGHGLAHLHPGLQHDHQMAGGRGEVVDIGCAGQGDDAGVLERAVGGQTPDNGLGPVHAEIPDAAVALDPRVGEERHGLQVVAQGDEAARLQRVRVHGHGRSAFPQGPEVVADPEHRGVGGIGVVVRSDAGARVTRAAEAGHDHGVQFRFLTALGCVGETGRQGRLTVRDAEPADQAVTVEPVLGRAARPPEFGRAVAIEGALQPRRSPAMDPRQAMRGDVALDVARDHAPVRGDAVLGQHQTGGLGGVGGDDGAAHGCGPQQEGSTGRDHDGSPRDRIEISAG